MLASTLTILPNEQEISAMLFLQESRNLRRPIEHRLKVTTPPLKNALLYGNDYHVSDTRKMLRESIGYQVHVASNTDEALQFVVNLPIETAVICHTTPSDSAERFMVVARSLQPSINILCLATGRQASHQHLGDGVHDTCDGPAAFLQKVKQMALTSRHPY